jgi:glycosyltransferase involved in cell wall biosynthesis
MSRVDVIVPCYKYAHFLKRCVESVLSQPVDVRVLIIDDASPDNTAEVAAELVADDPRVEFRQHVSNRGHIATYNEGLDWACGDYMLLLSADDLLTPGALERSVRLMEENPDLGFTCGRAITTSNPDVSQFVIPKDYRTKLLSGRDFLKLSCAGGGNFVSTPTAVVRTHLQKEIGGYRADLPHTGDLEMWLRFAVHAPVGVLDCEQAFYRVHGQNMHKVTFPSAMIVIEQHREAYETIFREYGQRIRDVYELRELAKQTLALGVLRRAAKTFDQGDLESCERFMRKALEISNGSRMRPEWWRLRMKQALGPNLWTRLRAVRHRLRRSEPTLDLHPFGRSGLFPGM